MSRLLQSYLRALETSPNITKAISAGILLGLGDALSQGMEFYYGYSATSSYDYARTAKMSSYGFFVVGPLLHQWYKVLNRFAPKQALLPGVVGAPSKFQQVAGGMKQVAIDQIAFAPPSLALFFFYMNLIEGKSWVEVWNKLSAVFWSTLIVNWKVWPLVQFSMSFYDYANFSVNFTFVPLPLRVLVVNIVSIFWNAYLSYVQYTQKH
jgi:protein Mpv17